MSSAFNDREGYNSNLKTKGEDLKPAFKSLKEISENDKIKIIKLIMKLVKLSW